MSYRRKQLRLALYRMRRGMVISSIITGSALITTGIVYLGIVYIPLTFCVVTVLGIFFFFAFLAGTDPS